MFKQYYIKATYQIGEDDHKSSSNFKADIDLESNNCDLMFHEAISKEYYYREDIRGVVVDFMIEIL